MELYTVRTETLHYLSSTYLSLASFSLQHLANYLDSIDDVYVTDLPVFSLKCYLSDTPPLFGYFVLSIIRLVQRDRWMSELSSKRCTA